MGKGERRKGGGGGRDAASTSRVGDGVNVRTPSNSLVAAPVVKICGDHQKKFRAFLRPFAYFFFKRMTIDHDHCNKEHLAPSTMSYDFVKCMHMQFFLLSIIEPKYFNKKSTSCTTIGFGELWEHWDGTV